MPEQNEAKKTIDEQLDALFVAVSEPDKWDLPLLVKGIQNTLADIRTDAALRREAAWAARCEAEMQLDAKRTTWADAVEFCKLIGAK